MMKIRTVFRPGSRTARKVLRRVVAPGAGFGEFGVWPVSGPLNENLQRV